ncbi:hypothetical protein [Myxococcus vastator]|uniref:hypothetical protein n=1 Tax=Myxococcus vastator TaxID=2709664 RepID=UPI0019689ED5|nr:hypothetical protein [Myxococcus vastator]
MDFRAVANTCLALGLSRRHAQLLELLATQAELCLAGIREIRLDVTPFPSLPQQLADLGWTYLGEGSSGHVAGRPGLPNITAPSLPALLTICRQRSSELDTHLNQH